MLKLPHVYASGALYQQQSWLTVRGEADTGATIDVLLFKGTEKPFSAASVTADETGHFDAAIYTPAASLDSWTIVVTAGEETVNLDNILFGELWLASGQSNMELSNHFQPEVKAFLTELAGRSIRVYHVDGIEGGCAGMFPWEPLEDNTGRWGDVTDIGFLDMVSAAGTAFVKEVYDYLQSTDREIPVGFVNASWGGTGMPCWIPRSAMDKAGALCDRMKEIGSYPNKEQWNTRGDVNFQQPSCQYNLKISCLLGLQFRGIIWYQGENECGGEHFHRVYKSYLYLYQQTYKELFAVDDHFPMISSLIYPWAYSKGDCFMGYLNQAFIDAATEAPDRFLFAPITDLPPVWGFGENHPIHPTHKYAVGKRMGMLAESAVYGKDAQPQSAVLCGYEVQGNKLLLHFAIPGGDTLTAENGIRLGETGYDKRPIGLYICGASGVYVPATLEIIAPDTIALSHPGIDVPCHAAYGYNSMEEGCNLWAGLYPVAYFRTDDKKWNADNVDKTISIEAKPWCDTTKTSVWVQHLRGDCGDLLDVFYHPIWKPACHSEVCADRAFTLADGSIRIALAETEYSTSVRNDSFGAYVESHPYNRLDLQNYKALTFRVLNHGAATISLVLTYREKDGVILTKKLPAVKTGDLAAFWAGFTVNLEGIPDGEIAKMAFQVETKDTWYHFVNIEDFVLMPR